VVLGQSPALHREGTVLSSPSILVSRNHCANIGPFTLTLPQNEKFTLPADGHNMTGQYDPAVHSLTGMNAVSLPGWPRPIDDRVIQASHELGNEFAFNLDHNSGNQLGLGEPSSLLARPLHTSLVYRRLRSLSIQAGRNLL